MTFDAPVPPTGIFLYGGCVSRDSYAEINFPAKLTGYVARQSLISAFNRPAKLLPQSLTSDFQNRMVRGDIDSNLVAKIEERLQETDVIVLDLLVERLGVTRIRGGSFVTMSSEMKRSKALDAVRGQTRSVRFGTEEHFEIWSAAAKQLSDFLSANLIKSKTLILETPWAEYTDSGRQVGANANMLPEEANEKYERYYRFLSDVCGIATYRLPSEHVVAAENHRWGVAPYHYIEPAYKGIIKRINEVAYQA